MIEVICKNVFPKDYYTKEENKEWFIKALRRDILKAVELWDKKHKTEYQIKKAESFAAGLEKIRIRATEEAEHKYKTIAKQQEYINAKLVEYISNNAREIAECKWYHGITFFDFDLEPGQNSIHGTCVLSIDDLSDEKLEACWNDIKDNKYFKEADGWQFENGQGRPQIKLHLPKKLQKEFEAEEESLGRAIENFYRGCKYWGD